MVSFIVLNTLILMTHSLFQETGGCVSVHKDVLAGPVFTLPGVYVFTKRGVLQDSKDLHC